MLTGNTRELFRMFLNYATILMLTYQVSAVPDENRSVTHRTGSKKCLERTTADGCCIRRYEHERFDIFFPSPYVIKRLNTFVRGIPTPDSLPPTEEIRPIQAIAASCSEFTKEDAVRWHIKFTVYEGRFICLFQCQDIRKRADVERGPAKHWLDKLTDLQTREKLKLAGNIRTSEVFAMLCPEGWSAKTITTENFWLDDKADEFRESAECIDPASIVPETETMPISITDHRLIRYENTLLLKLAEYTEQEREIMDASRVLCLEIHLSGTTPANSG